MTLMEKFNAEIGASIRQEIEGHFSLQLDRIELNHNLKFQKLQRRNKKIHGQHQKLKHRDEERLEEIKSLKQQISTLQSTDSNINSTKIAKSPMDRFGDKSRRKSLAPHYAKEADLNKLVVTLDNNKNEMQSQIQSLCDKFEAILVQKQREQHRDRYALTPSSSMRRHPSRSHSVYILSPLSDEEVSLGFIPLTLNVIPEYKRKQRIHRKSLWIQQKSKCGALRTELVALHKVVIRWRNRSDLDFRHILIAFSSISQRVQSVQRVQSPLNRTTNPMTAIFAVHSKTVRVRQSFTKMTVFIDQFVHLHRVEMGYIENLIVHQLEREKKRKTKRKLKMKALRQSVNTLTVQSLLDRAVDQRVVD